MTQPQEKNEIAYSPDEAIGVYSNAQDTLSEHREGLPTVDGSGLEDPAIATALQGHAEKTRAGIANTEDYLGRGKKAVDALADTDKQSAARARDIGAGGPAALQRAMAARPAGPASPLTMPAAGPAMPPAPAPAAAPAMPATMPAAAPAPSLPQPGMARIAPDALARLVAGARLEGPTAASTAASTRPKGGRQPLAADGIDYRKTGNTHPLTKAQLHAFIDKALDNNGIRDPQVRAYWHDVQYNQTMKESSGVIDAVNERDINARGPRQADGAAQNCSRGLAQVTAETFARHHVAGTANAIYDPEANESASVAYQIAKEREHGHDITSLSGVTAYRARRAAAGYGAY